ncbi:hypothetical protein Rs2_04540 [Raphanus sativus]|nr:hypothetical protein Rs2_04540 [Raphanus sativus]
MSPLQIFTGGHDRIPPAVANLGAKHQLSCFPPRQIEKPHHHRLCFLIQNTGELHRVSPEISTRGVAVYSFNIIALSTGEHPSITRDLLPIRSQTQPPDIKRNITGAKKPLPKENSKADRSLLKEMSNDGTAKPTAHREEGAVTETKDLHKIPKERKRKGALEQLRRDVGPTDGDCESSLRRPENLFLSRVQPLSVREVLFVLF